LLPGHSVDELREVNIAGTANVAEACARNRVKRLVFVSSTSVYRDAGSPFARGIDERSPLLRDASTDIEQYGLSKVGAERLLGDVQRTKHLPCVVIRAPIVFGTGDGWDGRLLESVRRQPWLTLSRLPAALTLQCVHVDDLTDGILLAASHPAAARQVFNMAGAQLFSLRDLGRQALPAAPGGFGEHPQSPDEPLKYDIRKAQLLIGYAPKARLRPSTGAGY
jgi:nucleoside-diphosphate-sugar epimerase